MPTKRRRVARFRETPISDGVVEYFRTGDWPSDDGVFFDLLLMRAEDQLKPTWAAAGAAILADWIQRYPGTRPWAWWEFDAPRWRRQDWPRGLQQFRIDEGRWPEPRQRLGGIGTPKFEVLAYSPDFRRGIPTLWVAQWEVEYYNSLRVGAQALDPLDPPTFEGEATYLDRHGVLTPAERRRVPDSAFAVERLDVRPEVE